MIDCLSSSIFSKSRSDKFAKPLFSLVVLCFVDLKTLPMFLQPSLNLQSRRETLTQMLGCCQPLQWRKLSLTRKKSGKQILLARNFIDSDVSLNHLYKPSIVHENECRNEGHPHNFQFNHDCQEIHVAITRFTQIEESKSTVKKKTFYPQMTKRKTCFSCADISPLKEILDKSES